MSNAEFTHDVFLSHSAKDKPLAQRLRKGGPRRSSDAWAPLVMTIIL